MKQFIYMFLKYIALLCVGGAVYCVIELLYRGRTHWTMWVVGGICFIFCGLINELFKKDMLIWKQMAICAIGITVIEFISGLIINVWLHMGVWDYSALPLNIMGQICLPFMIIWYFLSFIAIALDDWIRYLLFDEEEPHYRFR